MGRTMRNIPGIARRGTPLSLEYKRTISLRCPQKFRVEWQKNCPRSLAERRVAFWALSKRDEFLLNPQVPVYSASGPETSRNSSGDNQEPDEDRSQNDPHPEAIVSLNQFLQDCCPDEAYNMVTEFHEEIPYCSPGPSSGKQKKARSTSQQQFRSEITPATIEVYQFLLALQQLASNSNSANFNNNNHRISKRP